MRLDVYISNHCVNCHEALLIAEHAKAIPNVLVTVINVDEMRVAPPPNVIAVPTYLLDGRVVSLGNPERQNFLDELARRNKEKIL